MMKKPKPAAAAPKRFDQQRISQHLPAVVVGVNLMLLLTNLLLLSLLPQTASQVITTRSEKLAQELQGQSAQKLAVDLTNTEAQRAQLSALLPNRSRLLEVIEAFDALSSEVTLKDFSFASENPMNDPEGFSYLPLAFGLEGSLSQVMTAVTRIQKSPFLLTVEQAILESPAGLSQAVRLNLIMRLYVSEPFDQAQ